MINIRKRIERKNILKETLLTPRFYTTNFKEISELDINLKEVKTVIEEFRIDYNRDHFIRDKEFLSSLNFFDEKIHTIFIEFLERSCTAEFSGFLLYKEISRNLKKKNPLLAEGFSFMSRDEARHAGFLNKVMSDFNIFLNLGFLTQTRKYTFFLPKFVFYATFLSEKIGYWRYIAIYRYLEKNPKYRIFSFFLFFENWCQDENRHADFFAAILKSQKHLLNTYESKLWCKFFLLAVFITMYLNDSQRKDFYRKIGINVSQFDEYVIRKTNQNSGILFPIILNVNNPKFFELINICNEATKNLLYIEKEKTFKFIKFIKKSLNYLLIIFSLLSLYLLPVIETKHKEV